MYVMQLVIVHLYPMCVGPLERPAAKGNVPSSVRSPHKYQYIAAVRVRFGGSEVSTSYGARRTDDDDGVLDLSACNSPENIAAIRVIYQDRILLSGRLSSRAKREPPAFRERLPEPRTRSVINVISP
ncbi:hypothetical protein EVAR_122_1 [Eumeta japonica]|uniref:Uncharacterized protein n=1 Tax=Eumeta variegata TaxID=151549 RepID=A0A4C1SAW2_EUMVA|nr:hypothetical protein EVAR_122_1 [Eumeta japonica]